MKSSIIFLIILLFFSNFKFIKSYQCPADYIQSSPPYGLCRKGSQTISSGYCLLNGKYFTYLGNSIASPCPSGSTTVSWASQTIENNQFNLKECQLMSTLEEFKQVYNCAGNIEMTNSTNIEFVETTARYYVVSKCSSNIMSTFTLELSSLPSATQESITVCEGLGSVIETISVYDYGETICPIGYSGSPCYDINECNQSPCGTASCINNDGGYTCICPPNYLFTGTSCEFINPCSTNNGGCGHGCVSNENGFYCTCNPGYRLNSDQKDCSDINECNEGTSGCTQICSNTQGGFFCGCNPGYSLNSDQKTCVDINECSEGTSGCTHSCSNTKGGFTCGCNDGYILADDGKSCNDINECNDGSNGGCGQMCLNMIGSYVCSCFTGYALNSDAITCHDINECEIPNFCKTDQTCKNLIGSYNCEEFEHSISSIIPSTTKGGQASFFGEFSDKHNNLTITINGIDCPVTFNSSNLINCTAAPGTGMHSVNLTQNGRIYTATDRYLYEVEFQECPSDCNSNKQQGTCNKITGECNCIKPYTAFDCSLKNDIDIGNGIPQTNSTVDPNTGGSNLSNEQTNFQIYLKALIEVDFNGNEIKSFLLQDKWKFNNTNLNNTYILEQYLNDTDSNGVCKITSIIEEIKDPNGKEFTFGDTKFRVENGLVKFTIIITNYTYSSFLNTLQLQLISSVGELNDINNNYDCNSKDTEIDTSNILNDKSTFNYIKISKNNKIFSGRFINKLISDGRPTFFKTTTKIDTLNSIIISLDLPHAKNEIIIDPDFSVLVSPDFNSNCESSTKRSWVIPVAVVVSVVGAAIIATALIFLFKKNVSIKIGVAKLKKLNK